MMKKSTKIVIVTIAVLLVSVFLILYLQIIVNTIYGIDHTSQILDLEIEVTGMKPVYYVGEPITFSVHVKTLGTFVPWPDFRIYKDEYVDNTSEPVFSRNYMTPFEPDDKFNLTAWREQTWNFPLETDTGNPMISGNNDGIIRFFEEGTYVLRVNAWGKQEKLIEFEIADMPSVIIPRGVVIEGNEDLIPKEITVVLGKNNTVTWINQDDTGHGIASDYGSWGSPGIIKPGESFSVTFNNTGIFEYHGEPGPWITGKVIVTEE